MNKHLRVRSIALALGLIFGLVSVVSFVGCRGGEGKECLADSDCSLGLVCLKREKVINNERYEERWGTCHQDDDADSVPADGDLSGSTLDRRCGVHAIIDLDTATELVLEQVVGKCDDNCPDTINKSIMRDFVCLARDDCCPATEKQKKKATRYDRCSDVTDQTDTCTQCTEGANPTPKVCFLEPEGGRGFDVDEDGCLHCRPLSILVPCGPADPDACQKAVNDGTLPKAACSGSWGCVNSFCKFSPVRQEVQDAKGFSIVWQLDSDWDGVGDACDNCKFQPNGIECTNPLFQANCDVNQDGIVTPDELDQGEQLNQDGDEYGDACDLCPNLADKDNKDLDGDGRGNPCDCDDDGDGICDPGLTAEDCRDAPAETCQGSDNCPEMYNPNQGDLDGDGKGDLCDADVDGDGIYPDGDGSGVAGDNPCETGQTRNCDDNCPEVPNGRCVSGDTICDINYDGTTSEAEEALGYQLDTDGDGVGDACE